MIPKREPGLHISEMNLIKLVEHYYNARKISLPAEELAHYLMRNGVNYSLINRKILESSEKIKKTTTRIKESTVQDALMFSSLLSVIRKRVFKHRGIKKIIQSTKDFKYMHEGASLANNFCESFGFKDKRKGYIEYITLAIKTMKRFTYTGFNALYEQVIENYEAKLTVDSNKNSDFVTDLFNYYQELVYEKTGIYFNEYKNPERYVHFIKAGEIAVQLGLTPEMYVDSQFESLSYRNILPTPSQISTVEAKERALKWMAENGVRVDDNDSSELDALIKIRQMGDEDNPE